MDGHPRRGQHVPGSSHQDGNSEGGVCAAAPLHSGSAGVSVISGFGEISSFKIHQEGAIAMAEEKEKAIEKDQETIKPAGSKKPGDDLSEEDLKKAAGGITVSWETHEIKV
jgi:hypothetical protein